MAAYSKQTASATGFMMVGAIDSIVPDPIMEKQQRTLSLFCKNSFVCACSLSHVPLFAVPWTVAHQAPLPMEFSRQEYWSGVPFPSPGDLPDQEREPRSSALQAVSLPSESPRKTY